MNYEFMELINAHIQERLKENEAREDAIQQVAIDKKVHAILGVLAAASILATCLVEVPH